MTLKKGIVLGCLGLIAIGITIPLVSHYIKLKDIEAEYDRHIEEGFAGLERAGEEGLDLAVRRGLSAKEINPAGVEAHLLLGRAYYLKKNLNQSIEELREALKQIEAIDFHSEIYYHLGLAHLEHYKDLQGEDIWKAALEAFSQAASLGHHRADACFGMALLYFMRYRENPSLRFQDRIVINLQNCQELEDNMDGYIRGEPGSPCPRCRQSFQKKSDQEVFQKLLASFLDN